MTLILLTSVIAVSMPQQAFAVDGSTHITFDDGGSPGSGTLTVSDTDGISTIAIVFSGRTSFPGATFTDVCPDKTSFSTPLTFGSKESFTVTVVDCTGSTPTSATFGNGSTGGGGGGTEKVEVCHKGKTITVSASAVQAHEDHGDTLGPCS